MGVLIVATLLIIASGWMFYRYLAVDVGAGGRYALLSDRLDEFEQALVEVERKLSTIVTALPEEDAQGSPLVHGGLAELDERVSAIEQTIRLSPDDAIELPMVKRDIEELRAAISDLRTDYSNWNSVTQNLVTLLYGLVIALGALVVGPQLVRLLRGKARSPRPREG